MTIEYKISKAECEANISGVCPGCGGNLSAIATVDNAGSPTHWQGCENCCAFRQGVKRRHYEIARQLVEDRIIVPHSHMRRGEYEDSEDSLKYYLDCQTAGLSPIVARIDRMLACAKADLKNARRRNKSADQ